MSKQVKWGIAVIIIALVVVIVLWNVFSETRAENDRFLNSNISELKIIELFILVIIGSAIGSQFGK